MTIAAVVLKLEGGTYLKWAQSYWNNGDDAWQNPITKGFIVYGRSDETMDPKGARYNCSDIYFALEGFPGVKDSVVVSQYNKDMDERVILFVKMFPGHELTDKVKEKINETIEHHLTYEHIPDIIMEAPDIPVCNLREYLLITGGTNAVSSGESRIWVWEGLRS
ncbi:Acetoacetyl-CoA synthetase [Araneus ventricosus]|uniref:Acetoacetyl-CoA synthetase n=1 Tax=Araneus ventricosus TaxID=182803 RepID=A0A4Y2WDP0_ARAVE|nr:Acetoacetyl-CoA synthetase [Araneus ventricosus]